MRPRDPDLGSPKDAAATTWPARLASRHAPWASSGRMGPAGPNWRGRGPRQAGGGPEGWTAAFDTALAGPEGRCRQAVRHRTRRRGRAGERDGKEGKKRRGTSSGKGKTTSITRGSADRGPPCGAPKIAAPACGDGMRPDSDGGLLLAYGVLFPLRTECSGVFRAPILGLVSSTSTAVLRVT